MSVFAVVNPRAGAGRLWKDWPRIEHTLGETYPGVRVATTQRRGDATKLVRNALKEGFREIIAIGGDGTFNEAVNGFFDNGAFVAPDAVFGIVSVGTGGDLRKSFALDSGIGPALQRLKSAKPRPVDLGRVTCVTTEGGTAVRHFINIASAGMSGEIVAAVNRARISKLFGGRFAFGFHSARKLLSYRGRAVRLRVDRDFDALTTISTLAVANGCFFGGGMRIAPHAEMDDGLFDVIVLEAMSRRRALKDMGQIYSGAHLSNPSVKALKGTKIVAAPVAETRGRPVLVEVDGELAGQLPATFEILPRALLVRC